MFYERYYQEKSLRDSLRNKLEKQKKKENAPVTIRDLVVNPDHSALHGESNCHGSWVEGTMVERLLDHVKSLAQIANEYHQQSYCTTVDGKNFDLKPTHKNTITRLSLPEFSLYGERPLSLKEFSSVVQELEKLAQNSHDNVHLLLSSFSVVDNKGKLLNVVIYLQGGKNAKVDVICKGQASPIDVGYPNTSNFTQQQCSDFPSHISRYIAGNGFGSNVVSNNSVLEIETCGGARFTQGIDICLDHSNEHSKRLLQDRLDFDEMDTTHFVPEQADHIVTSNSIYIDSNSKITPQVLHVDPKPQFFDEHNAKRPIDRQRNLSVASLSRIQGNKYPFMRATNYSGMLGVSNPPFGKNYVVVIHEERQLGGYHGEIGPQIQRVNNKIMERRLDNMLSTRYVNSKKYIDQMNKYSSEAERLSTQLIEKLSNQCKISAFDAIFSKASTLKRRKEAAKIIAEAAQALMQLKAKDALIMSTLTWAKDLQYKLEALQGEFPPASMKRLVASVKSYRTELQSLMPSDPPSLRA